MPPFPAAVERRGRALELPIQAHRITAYAAGRVFVPVVLKRVVAVVVDLLDEPATCPVARGDPDRVPSMAPCLRNHFGCVLLMRLAENLQHSTATSAGSVRTLAPSLVPTVTDLITPRGERSITALMSRFAAARS